MSLATPEIRGEMVIFDEKTFVRRLVESDHEKVSRISKGLYNGYDTFSPTFPEYAKDREFHYVYGLFVDEKLVASLCRTFVQENICWGEALRTDESQRGKKYMSLLNIGARILIRQVPKFSKITHFRLTYAGLYGMDRIIASNFPKCVGIWATIVIPLDALDEILKKIPSATDPRLVQIYSKEFLQIHQNLPIRFKEYILSCWRFYDANESTIQMLEHGERVQEKCDLWKFSDQNSLSLSCDTKTCSGLRYSMTIEVNDMMTFWNHFHFHIKRSKHIGDYKAYAFHTEYLLAKEFEKYIPGTSAFFLQTTGYESIKWFKSKI